VTLAEVAAHAQVTAITVSRFLREPALVAPATAERIREALERTGYVPNRQAGQLAGGRSNMVAAIIPSIANSIFAETVQGLADALQSQGLELMLASTGYSQEREAEQLRAVLGWFPRALAVTGRRHSAAALALLRDAQASGVPVIEMWDQHADAEGFAQVGFDHEAAGRAVAQHLLERGHRRLAYVDSGVAEDFRARERGDGFAAAARAAGASVLRLAAAPGDAFDAGRAALHSLLGTAPAVTAAAFANDHFAAGALLEAQAGAVAVPQRLAVAGFGDFALGRQLRPSLTTLRPPRQAIGLETGLRLIEAVRSGMPPQGCALPWELLPRQSTADARAGGGSGRRPGPAGAQ
jgi:LacI family gluconate utilization system Gnt-I transcriptional repressor